MLFGSSLYNESVSENNEKNIGVVGFSAKKFDEKLAESILGSFLDAIETLRPDSDKCSFTVVSGLTNLGVPGIAYKLAEKRKWKTIGIACKKAEEYECFDVDESIIVGDDWGDESKHF